MEHDTFRHIRAARLLAAALLILLLAVPARAQGLSLMAPAIANDSGSLVARFGIKVEAVPILKGELIDGAALVLTCAVSLHEINDYWLDSHLASTEFSSTLNYDALTREFTLSLPGRETPLRNQDLEALLKDGWSTIEAGLGQWSLLEPGTRYSLGIHTTLNEADAPEGLTRYIYFWSWDAVTDNTFLLNFTF